MKILISFMLLAFSLNSFPINYLKQKVTLTGNVKAKKVYTIEELSKLPQTTMSIYDPYSENKKISFQGVLLKELLDLHGMSTSTKIEVFAINNYKVTLERSFVEKEKMLLAIKADGTFLTARDRGPARIVVPGKGKMVKDGRLAKEGVSWVWYVRDINFL